MQMQLQECRNKRRKPACQVDSGWPVVRAHRALLQHCSAASAFGEQRPSTRPARSASCRRLVKVAICSSPVKPVC